MPSRSPCCMCTCVVCIDLRKSGQVYNQIEKQVGLKISEII